MDITFNTKNCDATVALNALKYYKAKEYKLAEGCLLQILDYEPSNWDARLLLAICYYKTGQMFAAQRAFRHIWQNCKGDEKIRQNAMEGMQAATARLQTSNVPAEFGNCVERSYKGPAWLD